MKIRDRIIGLERVRAGDLIPNAKNWRTHPTEQRDALKGILAEVGYVDALLARRTPEGGLELIDGHLRAETTPDMEVPVLVVDLDDAEAAKVLATFDPLAALANADATKLEAILRDVDTGSEALQQMLDDLAKDEGIVPAVGDGSVIPPEDFPEVDEDIETNCTCPKCGYKWSNGGI